MNLPRLRILSFSALLFATLTLSGTAQWNGSGPIWTNDDVGIGDSSPGYRLKVTDGADYVTSLFENTRSSSGTALYALSQGTSGTGILGSATASSGTTTGVFGYAYSTAGRGLFGYAAAGRGTNYGVYGQTNSSQGYSGYFKGGDFHVSAGFTGIGRTSPINGSEVLGCYKPTTGWGGMYMETQTGGLPYYGYATGGSARAYHYYNSSTNQWVLHAGGTRLAVNASNGNVGIGTSSPAYRLHVNGSAGKPGGGSWSNASDRRLKKNIAPLQNALDRLLTVRGVSYEYREPDRIHELRGRQLGVVAQEVEKSFPNWVDEDDNGMKRVTFRGFEGVTIEALRELNDRNDELRRELASVRAENTRLAADVDALIDRLARLESQVKPGAN